MERGLPGLRAPLLAGRPRPGPRAGVTPHGSSDIYAPSGRRTYASINFVTCHDGFTLTDLVSYEHKHNEANGEENRDGAQDNASRNWGAEGPSDSARIQRARDRMKRNFLTTLLFAQGVPMLLGGDEIGRTQQGNNNAYCQDNEISWFDWDIGESGYDMRDFVRDLIASCRATPSCAGGGSSPGPRSPGTNTKDVTWIRSNGQEMTDEAWSDPNNQSIGMLLFGRAADEVDIRGRSAPADTLLLLLNAGTRSHSYTLPRMETPGLWEELLNTARPGPVGPPGAQRGRQPHGALEPPVAPHRAPPRVTAARREHPRPVRCCNTLCQMLSELRRPRQ